MVEKSDDGKLHAKSVQLSLQWQWTRWCDYIKLDLSSKSLLAIPQPLPSFCLGATCDTTITVQLGQVAYCSRWCVFSLIKTSFHISSHSSNNCGLLHTAPDWVLLSDLESTLVIPPAIAITQLRPDILLCSISTKTVIILELTCPLRRTWNHGMLLSLGNMAHFVQQLKQTPGLYISLLWK